MIPAPRHDRIKKVLQKGFGLKRINEMRETMRAVANRLLDRMIEHGQGDLVEDFTHRYPLEVLCTMMGVPEDRYRPLRQVDGRPRVALALPGRAARARDRRGTQGPLRVFHRARRRAARESAERLRLDAGHCAVGR
jgi:cytochrome P450